jgi:Flp pilus assembly protein TadD
LVLNFCYSCPDLCDPAKALELAREAVRYDSGSSFAYTVHGSALYRLGRFEEAREALLRSAELSLDADDHINVFFLAMASFESGKTREARKCYDSALAEMNASYHSKNPVSINVRNEAAEILGLR